MNDLDIKLDRLVDGELSQQEYGSLLSSLENEQDGWKRCALAFLENQALKRELPELLQEESTADANPVEVARQSAPPRAERHWPQWLAVAASLFLMFWLGRGSIVPTTGSVSAPGAREVARSKSSSESLAPRRTLPNQGEMTLVVSGTDGQSREVELPVLNGEQIDPREVLARETDIPQDLIDALEASGHRIERYRELVPIRLDRERQVVVPVDRVRVVPAKRPTF